MFGADLGAALERGLHRLPHTFPDDAQLRHLLDQPLSLGVGDNARLAGARIDQLAGAVEDQLTGVETVLQDAVAAFAITVDRRGPPVRRDADAAAGRAQAVAIEPLGDRAGAGAGGIFGEDAADDRGLIRVDIAQATDQLPAIIEAVGAAIAEGETGGVTLLGERAALAALDLGGKVDPELGVHQPAEGGGDVGHLAIGEGEDPRAGVDHALADRERVALVAGDAVGRLGQDLIDRAVGVTHVLNPVEQGVEPRPGRAIDAGGAADGMVSEDARHFPAFAGAALTAQRDLILDRAGVLQCRAEAGVDQGAHGSAAPRFRSVAGW